MDDLGGQTSRWQSFAEDLASFHVPSPVVERSVGRSHALQRRTNRTTDSINQSLRSLNNVISGGTPLATSIQYHTPAHSIFDQTFQRADTPSHRDTTTPVMSVSLMDNLSTVKDVHLIPVSRNTTTYSPNEESNLVQFSFRAESPPNVTYLDHPILQVGLNLMTSFHHHLQTMNNPSQLIDLMEALEKTCATQIEYLKGLENSKQTKEVLVELKLEHDTWQLVKALYLDRLSREEDEEEVTLRELTPRTDKEIIDDYFSSHSEVRQAQIVVDWLERIAANNLEDFPTKVKYYTDSVSWDSTLHDLQYGLNKGHIVTELDPDCRVRQKKRLSELDEKDELSLSKHLFECVRAGELDKAQCLCLQCGQPWKAATLNGWKLYHDPNLSKDIGDELEEVEGNPTRDIWKLSCWNLIKCPSFNDYDRAIYSAFSGNLHCLLNVSQSWYDHVWAYFKVMVDVLVEQRLRSSNRYPNDHTFVQLPKEYWDAILIPEVVFQEIEASQSQIIRKQCLSYYHLTQKHLILGSLEDLIDEMHYWLNERHQTNGHLLRFMAHMVLFIKTVSLSFDENKCHDILEAFIKILISHRLNGLVALYCSYLSRDRQIVCYSNFLSGIIETKEQKRCLELASECGLDLFAITKRIVETTRQKETEEPSTGNLMAHDLDITQSDQIKISSLDWLLYDPLHCDEAIFQANALIREFLAVNKHRAALAVFEKIPPNSVEVIMQNWKMKNGSAPLSSKLTNDIHEHLCIRSYLEAMDSFNVWFEIFHHTKPSPPSQPAGNDFKEQVAYERRNEKYKEELSQWEMQLQYSVKDVENKMYNVLLFVKGGWMVDDELEKEVSVRSQQMKRLRQLCIPKICFLLHSVFHSTGNYKKCLQIADFVASDSHCLYKEFSPEELKQFLHLLHSSALEQTESVEQDSFGYPLVS